MQSLNTVAVRVNGEAIGLFALIQRARMRGQTQFIDEAINAEIVREAAGKLNIEVSRDEAQEAANTFREKHSLLKAQDMVRWLEERGMTVSDWQRALEEDVLIAKFKRHKFDSKVESFFAEHKLQYDSATIGRIVAPNEGLASEIVLQVREEGAVFEDVARKYSTDIKTRDTGGFVGKITRKDLGAAASSAVFGGNAGSVHGPFKAGKEFHVLRLIALHPATLDDDTREQIKGRMFSEWLAEMREKSNVEIPLFDAVPAVVETV